MKNSRSIEILNSLVRELRSLPAHERLEQSFSLDLEKADILERWEAVLLDPEFPDRETHVKVMRKIIEGVESGLVTLRRS